MLITVSGMAGTGKSTLAKALAERLSLEYVCAGNIIREMAKKQGMDILEFGEYLKQHPELDIQVDEQIIALGKQGIVVLEGRLAAWMMDKNEIKAYKVLLRATPEVAATRIVEREGGDLETAMRKAAEREATNWKRYAKLYGVSADDEAWYDLVVNTDGMGIEEVLDFVLAKIAERHA